MRRPILVGDTVGGWISVACNCDDRRPVDDSLFCQEYVCGHRSGELLGVTLGDVLEICGAIRHAFGEENTGFEVSLRIGDSANYQDELLVLTRDERDLWRCEVEQLRQYLDKSPPMAWENQCRWDAYWTFPDGWVGNDQLSRREMLRRLGTCVEDVLDDIVRLCETSAATGTPITFLQ